MIFFNLKKKCKISYSLLFTFFAFFTFQPLIKAQDIKSEKITLNIQKQPIVKVFKEITDQTGLNFFYSEKVISKKQNTVNLKVTNADVKTVLDELTKQTSLYFIRQGKTITVSDQKEPEQKKNQPKASRKITGIVKDQNDEPVIGASVAIKGTAIGTITDLDGAYSLEVEEGTLITVSYVGYSPIQFTVSNNKSEYNISLKEDSEMLSEVVVVGYGTQKKVNLTGAVTQITSEDFKDRPVVSVGHALQGMIPNFNITFGSGQPGAGATYNIRGNTSPNGGSPLILIDGIETYPERINSNDIESITVLKDASSAAIYGARGAFGVILITTKSGKREQTPTVTYNGYFSVSKPTTSTDFETRGYYSAKVADMFLLSSNNTPYTSYTEADYDALWERRNDKTEHPDRPWVITDRRNGMDSYVYLANFDWYNYLYDDSRPTHDHNINITGGDQKLSYMLSGRFYTQDGVQKLNKDDYKSYNFRSKISLDVKPWLTISNNTKFFSGIYNFTGLDSEYNNWRRPTLHALASFVPVNPDGTAVSHTSMTYSSSHYIMDGYNAMMQKGKTGGKKRTQEFTTKFDFNFTITKDLSVKADFGYTKGYLRNDFRSVNVEYSQYPGVINTEPEGNYPDSFQEVVWDQEYYITNIYGNYKKSLNDHNMDFTAGYNYEAKNFKDLKVTRKGLLTEDLSDFNLATGDITELTGGKNQYAIMGWFYRAAYNFKGKYLFEANGRYDGSSRFRRGDRYGFFPSFSAGYRISEESFFTPLRSVIDNIKIRASYGSLGNQQIGYYDYIQNINTKGTLSNYSFDGLVLPGYARADDPVASNMTWEKVISKNLGFDLNMLNSRINLEVDTYIRDTKDILTQGKKLPSIYGANEPKINANDIRTKGYEITLNWRDSFTLLGSKFNYSITGTLADYTAEYTKVDNPSNLIAEPYKGKKMGEIWGYRVDGLFRTTEEAQQYANEIDLNTVNKDYFNSTGAYGKGIQAGDLKYLDLNGDKIVNSGKGTLDDSGDRVIIGNSQPRYSYGFNIALDWYGFDLSAFFQGIGRQHWYPGSDNIRFWGPYSRPYVTFLPENFMSNVWSEENPDAYFPRARAYSALSSGNSLYYTNDRYLQNLAYCRLKNLTIGYTLPKSLTMKAGIKNCRIYFSGENLFTTSKLKSDFLDPEEASAASDKKSNIYPWNKTFAFGLNLTF